MNHLNHLLEYSNFERDYVSYFLRKLKGAGINAKYRANEFDLYIDGKRIGDLRIDSDSEWLSVQMIGIDEPYQRKGFGYKIYSALLDTAINNRFDGIRSPAFDEDFTGQQRSPSATKLLKKLAKERGGYSVEFEPDPDDIQDLISDGAPYYGPPYLDFYIDGKSRYSTKISESLGSVNLLVVDVQPAYEKFFDAREYLSYISQLIGRMNFNGRVLYLYNGPELGYESESELIDWMVDNGFPEDMLGYVEFFDKGYGWFRYCMCQGKRDELVDLLKWMLSNGVDYTEEMDEEQWSDFISGDQDREDLRELIDADGGVPIPSVTDELKNLSRLQVMGGKDTECLAEILILLDALDIDYEELDDYIY